jgi:hypothetical protein
MYNGNGYFSYENTTGGREGVCKKIKKKATNYSLISECHIPGLNG